MAGISDHRDDRACHEGRSGGMYLGRLDDNITKTVYSTGPHSPRGKPTMGDQVSVTSVPLEGSLSDRAMLERFVGDVGLLCGVAEVFLESEPALKVRLREGIASQDAALVAFTAHSYRGSVGNFGAEAALEAGGAPGEHRPTGRSG